VISGSQQPLYSYDALEASVAAQGGLLTKTQRSDEDSATLVFTRRGKPTVRVLAKRYGPYIILRGDAQPGARFLTSNTGATTIILDSAAGANVVGSTEAATLGLTTTSAPPTRLFGAGESPLTVTGAGKLGLIFVNS
jgi:hypothetical protein